MRFRIFIGAFPSDSFLELEELVDGMGSKGRDGLILKGLCIRPRAVTIQPPLSFALSRVMGDMS